MVNKIIKIFHGEVSGVHQAAYLLGAFSLLSQILALFRDRMLAGAFGAGHSLDIYYAAFRVPDFIFSAIASLVSISVLIPFFSDIFQKEKSDARELMSSIFTAFMFVILLISGLAYIFMPKLIPFILPGLNDPASQAQLIILSRILLLQPICLGISNLLGVITQISKRFFIYALSPILYNIFIIFGIVVLVPIYGLKGIVIGVVLGGIAHFAIQIPFVAKQGLIPRLSFKIKPALLKQIIFQSVPRTLTLSASSLELIFITSFASLITVGSISIFNFSLNLQSVPFAIIGVSYALAAFPTLSACFSRGEKDKFLEHVMVAVRHIIFWSIPIAAFFIVLRAQIVRTVLGSGQFNWDNTRLTAACVALFTVSLVAQGLELLFIRAYYAAGKTLKPLLINLISSVLTIGLPFVLLQMFWHIPVFRFFIESLFKVENIPGSAVLMLPLGFTLGTIVNAVIFWIMFEKDFGSLNRNVMRTLMVSIQSAVIGSFVSYICLNLFSNVFNLTTAAGVFFQGLTAGLTGIFAIILILKLLRSEELEEIIKTAHKKIFKRVLIVSDPDKMEV